MANNLMSGTLSSIIKEQVETQISKGDTALASAYKAKKFDDCVQAIFQAFRKLATSNCAMSGSDDLIGSAAIHWYTEEDATVESIADILKSGTEVLKMDAPKTAKANKPKATVPSKATPPKTKASVPSKPTPPPAPQVVDDDDDFDID